jgi:hypothetical protein
LPPPRVPALFAPPRLPGLLPPPRVPALFAPPRLAVPVCPVRLPAPAPPGPRFPVPACPVLLPAPPAPRFGAPAPECCAGAECWAGAACAAGAECAGGEFLGGPPFAIANAVKVRTTSNKDHFGRAFLSRLLTFIDHSCEMLNLVCCTYPLEDESPPRLQNSSTGSFLPKCHRGRAGHRASKSRQFHTCFSTLSSNESPDELHRRVKIRHVSPLNERAVYNKLSRQHYGQNIFRSDPGAITSK